MFGLERGCLGPRKLGVKKGLKIVKRGRGKGGLNNGSLLIESRLYQAILIETSHSVRLLTSNSFRIPI